MDVLTWLPSVLYMFLMAIATIAQLPLSALVDGFNESVSNPFNNDVWTLDFGGMGDVLGSVFDWLIETLNVPADMPIFVAMLFITALTFFVVFLVRFLTGIIQ